MSTPKLTRQQRTQLNVAVRHMGRAMQSLERAGLPAPSASDAAWLWSLYRAAESLGAASDHLIDGLETVPTS